MQSEYGVPVEMNPGIDILPGAPAVRRRFEAVPYNGSAFNPDDTVQIYLPTGGASTFIDPHRSYLRMDIVNKNGSSIGSTELGDFTFTLPPGLNNSAGSGGAFWLDPSIGAQNFIRELRTYQSGLPLEEITDYDNLATVIAETEFGDAINSGLALQMWGAGGCYKPHFGSSSFDGNNPSRMAPPFIRRGLDANTFTECTTAEHTGTGTYPNAEDGANNTLSQRYFDDIVRNHQHMGDVFIKFLKPSKASNSRFDAAEEGYGTSINGSGYYHSIHGRDGYTNHVSTLLADGPDTSATDTAEDDYVVVKGIMCINNGRRMIPGSLTDLNNTTLEGAGTQQDPYTATFPTALDVSHDVQRIYNNHVCNLVVPSFMPYWHGMIKGDNAGDELAVGFSNIQNASGLYYSGIEANGFLGGMTSSPPFWKRAVCVPDSSLSSALSTSRTAVASDYSNGNLNMVGVTYQRDDSAATNRVTVCIPIISGIIGIEATKYFPSMLLASQSFYLELKLADYFGAIGNVLNTNMVIAYGKMDNNNIYTSRSSFATDQNKWLGGPDDSNSYPESSMDDGTFSKPAYSLNNGLDYSDVNPQNGAPRLFVQGQDLISSSSSFTQQASWQIQNIAFVGEEIIATPELTNELFSIASRQPIRWTTSSYRNYSQYLTCTSAQDNFDVVLPCTLQSVQRLYHTFRMKEPSASTQGYGAS